MKKDDHEASVPVPFGFVLLLVVFLALALFTFSAISLSTAKNDYSETKSMAVHKTEYARACNAAEEKTAALNASARKDPSSADKTKTFRIKINSSQVLKVSLRWNASENKYDTTVWRAVPAKKWKSDTTLPVIR